VPKQGKGMELVFTYFPPKEMEGFNTQVCERKREREICLYKIKIFVHCVNEFHHTLGVSLFMIAVIKIQIV
jgi:hypothetical protein